MPGIPPIFELRNYLPQSQEDVPTNFASIKQPQKLFSLLESRREPINAKFELNIPIEGHRIAYIATIICIIGLISKFDLKDKKEFTAKKVETLTEKYFANEERFLSNMNIRELEDFQKSLRIRGNNYNILVKNLCNLFEFNKLFINEINLVPILEEYEILLQAIIDEKKLQSPNQAIPSASAASSCFGNTSKL
jgi:hypothetical protein